MNPGPAVQNAFTVDVEDWFQNEALAASLPRTQWDQLSPRIVGNVLRLLELLAQNQMSATFFVLGWIADRHPELVRTIAAAGHEIASRGYANVMADQQTPAEFRDDIICAKALLEDVCGRAVNGYRAPGFSLGFRTPWAHAIIAECGYRYSSSVVPLRFHPHGVPNSPRFPYRIHQTVLEIPSSTVKVASQAWPAPSGGYFRFYPFTLTRWAIRSLNGNEGAVAVFSCRPWEFDREQPTVHGATFGARLAHYGNRRLAFTRIKRLLAEFRWGRVDDIFATEIFPERLAATVPTPAKHAVREQVPMLTLR